jgi:GNAT superfamily N-acetyltransferase
MKIYIQPLNRKDAHYIPRLIESGINKDILVLTIYHSKGYEEYLKTLLSIPEENRRIKFYGAFVDGHLVGFSEWRINEDELFLNNIFVLPEYKGMGIGKLLLVNHGKKLLDQYGKSIMSLDVFDHNTEALSWYKRLGFVGKYSTDWYTGEQPSFAYDKNANHCYIENYPIAEAEHTSYNFSMLTCSTKEGVYQIGRLKDEFYRLPNINSLNDYDLLHFLYKSDPQRKLLLLTSEEFSSQSKFTLACKSLRMIKEF